MINSVFLLSCKNGRDDEEHGGGAEDRAGDHEVHRVVRPLVHLHVHLLADRHCSLGRHVSVLVILGLAGSGV